jgi:integrase
LTDLRHFFTWAIRHDHYEGKNPVDGIDYEGVEEQHYQPFTDEDLAKLFGAPGFKKQKTAYPARYWLPLCLLYTSARREEIAQLTPADVKQEASSGVWYFDITSEDGKKLKNKASKRRVPVHAHLIDLGLLDYLEKATRRKTAPKYLFLKQDRKGDHNGRQTSGDAVSKWFARVRDQVGISGRKTLHSFRHTVVTRLIGLGVPEDIRKVLVGHADEDVHGSTYVHREQIPLKLLYEHLNKLDFSEALRGLRK